MTGPASGLVAIIGDAPHAWIMVNALRDRFGPFPVIREEGEPAEVFWGRRKKTLGAMRVLSMKAAGLAMKATKALSRGRIAALLAQEGVRTGPQEGQEIVEVASPNAAEAVAALQWFAPKAVFVCSTRVLTPQTLASVAAPFVNFHSGLNPLYRGMFGGYHALAEGEKHHFATTLHLIDEGIDTGGILATQPVTPSRADNFHTYVPLMAVESRDMVGNAMARVLEGDLTTQPAPPGRSRLWYGPTLGYWLSAGLRRGVW